MQIKTPITIKIVKNQKLDFLMQIKTPITIKIVKNQKLDFLMQIKTPITIKIVRETGEFCNRKSKIRFSDANQNSHNN